MFNSNDGLPEMSEEDRCSMFAEIEKEKREAVIAAEKALAGFMATFNPLDLKEAVILHTKTLPSGWSDTVNQAGIVDAATGKVLFDSVETSDSHADILAACSGKTIIMISESRVNDLFERANGGSMKHKTMNLVVLAHLAAQDSACDRSIGKRASDLYAGALAGVDKSVIETCQAIRDVVLKLGPTVVQHLS